MIRPFRALACPLDGEALTLEGRRWRCCNGHSFDVAAHGYAHLLPVQLKRSRDPGDSKAMVAARRRFLETGLYRPIAQAVATALFAHAPQRDRLACLDAGCGEGYYLRELAVAAGQDRSLELIGVDISKWAIQSAARQCPATTWVVGSNARLPVRGRSLDRVICLFGFPVFREFARVLGDHGEVLMVDPGPNHLRELREVIYPTLKAAQAGSDRVPEGFVAVGSSTLTYPVWLEGAELIADLLAMTPYLHRATQAGRARAAALSRLEVTVEVKLRTYRRA